MILLSGILLVFLVIAIYYIISLYNNFDEEVQVTDYTLLEERLEKQALIYLNDYYDEILTNEDITITRSILKSYNLDIILEDNNGNSCSGYVMAHKTYGEIYTTAYISCDNYVTEGYEEWRR